MLRPHNIIAAIQRAADEAAAKGVTVKVELHETGFFSTESIDVTITATPPATKGVAHVE